VIPEPDFLDLDAPRQPRTDDGPPLTALPPGAVGQLSTLGAAAAASVHDTLQAAEDASVRQGTGLIKAAVRVAKEEENERVGRLKDKLLATSNTVTNMLRGSNDNEAVTEPDIGDELLPKTKVSPPSVAQLGDVMLDMAGYHSKDASDQTVTGSESRLHFQDYDTATSATKAQEQIMYY